LHKLILCGREGDAEEAVEEHAGEAEDAEVAEGAQSAVVVVEAAQVEWAEAAVVVATAGLRCLAEAIVVVVAIAAAGATAAAVEATGPHRGPAAWLRIGTRPEETSTGLRPLREFKLVRAVQAQLFLRLLKAESAEAAEPATKDFPMWEEEEALVNSRVEVRAVVNSQGKVKALRVAGFKVPRAVRSPTECGAVNWARWQEARWREARSAPVSRISVEGIWAAEAIWAA
jgi:hypothetical protein